EARRVLREGGILLFNAWDSIGENPHALATAEVLEAMFPGDPEMGIRQPYSMNDRNLLRQLLSGGRFRETRIEAKRITVVTEDPRTIATGLIRGTPRAGLIENRGASLDLVIDKVAEAL